MDIINNNPNIEDTPKEKKVWCTFQNHDHCITINESTVLKCWNTLKKKYSSEEQSSFSESYLNGYQVVFDKTFLYKSKYYSFVVIKYQLS